MINKKKYIILSAIILTWCIIDSLRADINSTPSSYVAKLNPQLKFNLDVLQNGSTEEVRIEAASLILNNSNPVAADLLLDCLNRTDDHMTYIICKAMSQNLTNPPPWKYRLFPSLLCLLEGHDQASARVAAEAMTMFAYDDIHRDLEVLLDPQKPISTRVNAIYALKLHTGMRPIITLLPLLDDQNEKIVTQTIEALLYLGVPADNPEAFRGFMDTLKMASEEDFLKYQLSHQEELRRKDSKSKSIQKVVPLASVYLGCLFCAMCVLTLIVWKAKLLISLGLVGNLYYVLLLFLGLITAVILFGVLRSYASYTGNVLGGSLELGGPIIAAAGVVIGGFYLPKPLADAFTVTVLVHGERGPHDLVLRNNGTVWITLESDRRQERIGEKGLVDFKNIPSTFRGQEIPISIEADGFEMVCPDKKYLLTSTSHNVVVRRKAEKKTENESTIF